MDFAKLDPGTKVFNLLWSPFEFVTVRECTEWYPPVGVLKTWAEFARPGVATPAVWLGYTNTCTGEDRPFEVTPAVMFDSNWTLDVEAVRAAEDARRRAETENASAETEAT